MSKSLRSKRGSLRTVMRTLRSPLGPPFVPICPSPATRSICPSSIPAGTLIVIRAFFCTRPFPRQVGQGVSIILPFPPHFEHGLVEVIEPRIVRCWKRTVPVPLQSGQVLAVVPAFAPLPLQLSQTSARFSSTSCFTPLQASINEISRFIEISVPLFGAFGLALREPPIPPPKNESNISPRSIPSPAENPPKPPKPPAPCPAPYDGSTPA